MVAGVLVELVVEFCLDVILSESDVYCRLLGLWMFFLGCTVKYDFYFLMLTAPR